GGGCGRCCGSCGGGCGRCRGGGCGRCGGGYDLCCGSCDVIAESSNCEESEMIENNDPICPCLVCPDQK
ncbi:unnamed protein product, partial [Rotaria sp. Silwood1]